MECVIECGVYVVGLCIVLVIEYVFVWMYEIDGVVVCVVYVEQLFVVVVVVVGWMLYGCCMLGECDECEWYVCCLQVWFECGE